MSQPAASQPSPEGLENLPRPATGQARSEQLFWERYFSFYDTLLEAPPYRLMIERHVELLRLAPGERVLDAGTGTGNVAVALLAAGVRVVGVDFCEPALERCRAKAPAGEFAFADLTARLGFADGGFDKIACCNVIYTLPPEGQRNAVRELHRVLKPGGLAAVTVFGTRFRALRVYRETLRSLAREGGLLYAVRKGARYSINTARILYYVKRIKDRQQLGAYTFFSPEQLRNLLEEAGFVVELVEPTFASQCLLALARKPEGGRS